MNFKSNLSSLMVCLTLGIVSCNCAPTLETSETLVMQILNPNVLSKEPQIKLQLYEVDNEDLSEVGEPEQPQTGDQVNEGGEQVFEVEDEDDDDDDDDDLIVDNGDDLIDDDEDEDWDGEWDPNWGNNDNVEEEDDGDNDVIGGIDDDWEDDFDYIDNKETHVDDANKNE